MININGKIIDDEEAQVTTNNRGLLYGDAVFETLRVSSKKIFFLGRPLLQIDGFSKNSQNRNPYEFYHGLS